MEEGRIKEEDRKKEIRSLFDAIDTDGDKYISVPEMKDYIRVHKPYAIAPGIAGKILKMADGDGNRKLHFEEFYKLTQIPKLSWLIQYVNLVEPPRKGNPDVDEISGYGSYEDQMTCSIFTIMMILTSLLEVAAFIVDQK